MQDPYPDLLRLSELPFPSHISFRIHGQQPAIPLELKSDGYCLVHLIESFTVWKNVVGSGNGVYS